MTLRRIPSFLLISGWAVSAMTLAGCSTARSTAPFHMYSSPLLEGEMQSHLPRDRQYAPFELGDHQRHDAVYVLEKAAPQETGRPPSVTTSAPPTPHPAARDHAPQAPPTLSATRRATASQAGAAEKAAGPRPSDQTSSSPSPKAAPRQGIEGNAASYVYAMLQLNGVELPATAQSSIPETYKACRRDAKIFHGSRPNVGDLIFFHNTTDANGDGRNNDWYTLVGIVEQVSPSGTIDVLAYSNGKVQRIQTNLEAPDSKSLPDGKQANSSLRAQSPSDPPFTQYLAGQLFAGFCSLLGDRTDLVVVDNWHPGMSLQR